MSDQTLKVGGHDAQVTTNSHGMKVFRADPDDTVEIDVCLIDNAGREKITRAYKSALVISAPADTQIGSFLFDPLYQPVGTTGMMRVVTDVKNRPCFAQRPAMSRAEVFTLVEEIVAKNRGRLDVITDRERRILGGGR